MTGPVWLIARDTLRSLSRRKTNAVVLIILFWLLIVVSCSLKVTGVTVSMGGMAKPIEEFERLRLAVGSAFAGVHFLGLLIVLFIIVPSIESEVSSGLASWSLIKPIHRSRYLLGRIIGAFLFVAGFSAAVMVGVEFLLFRHAGAPSLTALAGWGVLLVLLAFYLSLGTLLALRLGPGVGALLLFVLALSGAAIDSDPLTRRVLLQGGLEEGAGFLDMLLLPLFGGGPPPIATKVVYGILYVVLPGAGNIHDLAVASAVGQKLPITLDWISFVLATLAIPASLLAATRTLNKREM